MGKTKKPDPLSGCCVVTCENHEFISENKRFYRFPLEKTQRDKWIAAVRKINGVGDAGNPWQPNILSIICCDHFHKNYKTRNPLKKNYVPTVFLDTAKRKSTLTSEDALALPQASGSGSGQQKSPPRSKTTKTYTKKAKRRNPLPIDTTLVSTNEDSSIPKSILVQTRNDAKFVSVPFNIVENDPIAFDASDQTIPIKRPFKCPLATPAHPSTTDETISPAWRDMQSKFIDHIVMAYLNRCRSRAGLPNIGMPNYILKAKAEEAAILLGTSLESRYGWLDRFKDKIIANDAMGIVLTKKPQSLNIADIIDDEWPKFSEDNCLDIDEDSEGTISVIDYEVEEEESVTAEDDTPNENNDDADDQMHQDIDTCSSSPSNIDPCSKETKVIERNQKYTSQPEFLQHVLLAFARRFKATWPHAYEIPTTILSSKFREGAFYLDSDIKNKNVWFRDFKHNIMNKKSFENIDIEAYRNRSLEINDIIEEEWPKFNGEKDHRPAGDDELGEITIEVTIEDDETNFSETTEIAEAEEINDDDGPEVTIADEETDVTEVTNIDEDAERMAIQINNDDGPEVSIKDEVTNVAEMTEIAEDEDDDDHEGIQTYEEARDCLNLLKKYALESSDSTAVAILKQMDTFLKSEDCKD